MKLLMSFVTLLLGICINTVAQDSALKALKELPLSYQGIASYYADKFEGRQMANGKIYNHQNLTAAANRIPLGSWVKISNLSNKKSVIVQITDRMHPKNKRLIDVSKLAAQRLGFIKKGLTNVTVEVIDKPNLANK